MKKNTSAILSLSLVLSLLMVVMTFFALPTSAYAAEVGKVQGVKVVKTTSSSVTLKWKRVNGATGYQIYYSIQQSKNYKKAKVIKKGRTVKATIKKLKSNKKYYFKIRAVKKTAKGKFSKPIAKKTKKAITYTITYKLNGGNAKNVASYTKEDQVIINPPSRLGYTFDGWTGTGLSAPTKGLVIPKGSTGNREYTAHWTAESYSITYDLAGGTLPDDHPTSYTINDEVMVNNPSRLGYTFDGWTGTGLSAPTKGLVIPKGSTGNREYTAHWTENYSITYDLAGGTLPDDHPTSYGINDEVLINVPTRLGYTFDGWTGTGLSELTKDLMIPKGSTGHREYTAHWTANQYTVYFDANTGSGYMNPETFTYDVARYLPENSFKNGSSNFICWNTKPDGTGTSYNNMALVKNLVPEGKITLYAQWASNSDYAMFDSGKNLNVKMKQLAGNSSATYSSIDSNITSIECSEIQAPEGADCLSVQSNNSFVPIDMWFEDGTIYYYSPAKYIFLNSDSSNMFSNLQSLTYIDFSKFRTDDTTNMSSMFAQCSSLTSLDLSSFNTAKVTNMSSMFYNCSGITEINVGQLDTRKVTNMNSMFSGCEKISHLNLSSFDTSKVADMEKMFDNLPLLETLDVSSFNTTSVTKMNCMFRDCAKLKALNLSSFDTKNVTTMSEMFGCTDRIEKSGLTSITINTALFNTSKVKSMKQMFYKCSDLKSFDFSGFNTAVVTDMSSMFAQCSSLTSLDLSSFNTGSVTNMSRMFSSCSSLETLDVSSFNTGSVTNMSSMFSSCSSLETLDVSSFNTSSVTKMSRLFYKMSKLATIFASDNFTTESVTDGSDVFKGDAFLKGGMGTECNGANNVGYVYARIDGGESSPGYFTRKE